MRRTIITILSTALVLAGTAAIVNAAGGGPDRKAAPSSAAKPQKLRLGGAKAHAAVKCRSLRCLNKKLTQLNRAVFKCERAVPVTSYGGYVYEGGGTTSALDYTLVGDAPTDYMLVDVCQ